MIRINLLDDIKVSHSHGATKGINVTGGFKPISIDGRQAANLIIKVTFILLPSIAVFTWYHIERTSKEEFLSTIKTREQEILAQIQKENQKYNEIKNLQKEILKLDRTIESLSQAAKNRTTTLQALNFLHHIVPKQTWLTGLEVSKDNTITFTGEAKPSDINIFAANLGEKKEIYRDINIIPNEDPENTKTDYTKFQISAKLVLDQDQEETPDNLEENTLKSEEETKAQMENTKSQEVTTSTDKKQ